jgi:hypothetical protein
MVCVSVSVSVSVFVSVSVSVPRPSVASGNPCCATQHTSRWPAKGRLA